MQLLTRPAINHDHAVVDTKRLRVAWLKAAKTSKDATQNHENKKGTTVGDGPGASGLSQGETNRPKGIAV